MNKAIISPNSISLVSPFQFLLISKSMCPTMTIGISLILLLFSVVLIPTDCLGSTATVSGELWLDEDGDGIKDFSEESINWGYIQVVDPDTDDILKEVEFNAQGGYSFDLPIGTAFYLKCLFPESIIEEYLISEIQSIDAPSLISAFTNERGEYTTSVKTLEENTIIKLGIYKGSVFQNCKAWFKEDDWSDEIDYIENIKVRLIKFNSNGEVVGEIPETVTDANGEYKFMKVPQGVYKVEFDRNGQGRLCWQEVILNPESRLAEVVNDGVSRTEVIYIGTNETLENINAGYYFSDHCISYEGNVWNDANADGVRQDDELGIPNVELNLSYFISGADTIERKVFTDDSGYYEVSRYWYSTEGRLKVITPEGFEISPKIGCEDYNNQFDPITGQTDFCSGDNNLNCGMFQSSTSSVNQGLVSSFSLTPNPATDKINIVGNLDLENSSYYIFSLDGGFVCKGQFDGKEISLSGLKSGVYLVKFISKRETFIERIVKI